MSDDLELFDPTPYRVDLPGPAPTTPGLSPDRTRTIRQARDLAAGRHPLTSGPLHPDAAPGDDRTAPGLRCGTCVHRELIGYHNRTYPKCFYGWTGRLVDEPPRATHGAATDVRAWWPACRDYQPADGAL